MKTKNLFALIIFLVSLNSITNNAQETEYFGKIEGKIIDSDSKSPLIVANVLVIGTTLGAATDADGNFIIEKIPVGNYSVQAQYLGYQTLIKTDVIVVSDRVVNIEIELKEMAIESDEVVVTGSYFQKIDEQPLSSINFSREEIRRAPGSAGDVSRILMSLPSVAKVNDQTNTLAVRGGSPIENTFYIDNIEIPNINHFPSQGASGGAIGMVNVDFISFSHSTNTSARLVLAKSFASR